VLRGRRFIIRGVVLDRSLSRSQDSLELLELFQRAPELPHEVGATAADHSVLLHGRSLGRRIVGRYSCLG